MDRVIVPLRSGRIDKSKHDMLSLHLRSGERDIEGTSARRSHGRERRDVRRRAPVFFQFEVARGQRWRHFVLPGRPIHELVAMKRPGGPVLREIYHTSLLWIADPRVIEIQIAVSLFNSVHRQSCVTPPATDR